MATKTINGKTYEVYTNADWERDKTLNVQVGQVIEPAVFWQLCNALPPHRWCMGVFQPGEAYSHDWDKGCALYQTFEDMGGNFYKYVGLKS